jgi:hypothetical protein
MVAQAMRGSLVFGVVGVVWYAMEHPGKCFLVKLGRSRAPQRRPCEFNEA